MYLLGVPDAVGLRETQRSRRAAAGGGGQAAPVFHDRAGRRPQSPRSSMAQNETSITSFPVEEKPPQPVRGLGGPPGPPDGPGAGGVSSGIPPLPASPPLPPGPAPRRCWGRFRGAAWTGGRGAQEPPPGPREVSVLPAACACRPHGGRPHWQQVQPGTRGRPPGLARGLCVRLRGAGRPVESGSGAGGGSTLPSQPLPHPRVGRRTARVPRLPGSGRPLGLFPRLELCLEDALISCGGGGWGWHEPPAASGPWVWGSPFCRGRGGDGVACRLSGARGGESACQGRRCRRRRFGSCIRKIPWRRKWQPTPVFLSRESHGQRSLAGHSPWGRRVHRDRGAEHSLSCPVTPSLWSPCPAFCASSWGSQQAWGCGFGPSLASPGAAPAWPLSRRNDAGEGGGPCQ